MAQKANATTAFDFAFSAIDGKPMPLAQFRGNVLLLVNTASECGFTPQYAGLEQLSRRYRDRGLVVIGVPSNDFGGQEPGTDAQILDFCQSRYDVSFPLTHKEAVIGGSAHPFYKWIAGELGEDHLPRWNFTKYLVGRDGKLRGMFSSKVMPESAEFVRAIEAELAGPNS
ncbi:MAG: glutathione peroxidase [Alphaproteobacteria bacterium]